MTMNSPATERVTGQVSPIGATFAVGALLVTSAIFTFFVGVFALAADEVVFRDLAASTRFKWLAGDGSTY
jgi:hypothetical protein